MGRSPLPSNQSLKSLLPQESQEEKLLRQGHSTHQTHWKNQETLVTVVTLRRLETVFA